MAHLLALLPTGALPVLFGFMNIGAAQVRQAVIFVLCLIAAVSVHEFSHALAAHKLGDPTPQSQGRLTLNPLAHYDVIGTLALPLILALTSPFLFGWGRPVDTQPRHYTRKVSMRSGMALVAFAGPLSNLVLAALTVLVVWGLSLSGVLTGPLAFDNPIRVFFTLNLLLFVFNLLPIHPLDGGKVLSWLLGPKYEHVDTFLLRWGGLILIVLVISPIPILGWLFGPIFKLGNLMLDAVQSVG